MNKPHYLSIIIVKQTGHIDFWMRNDTADFPTLHRAIGLLPSHFNGRSFELWECFHSFAVRVYPSADLPLIGKLRAEADAVKGGAL